MTFNCRLGSGLFIKNCTLFACTPLVTRNTGTACTLPSGYWCPPLTSVSAPTAEHNVSLGDTCPASSGATAEAPDHSDLE